MEYNQSHIIDFQFYFDTKLIQIALFYLNCYTYFAYIYFLNAFMNEGDG